MAITTSPRAWLTYGLLCWATCLDAKPAPKPKPLHRKEW